ncbi:VOC family protein [Georgenia sp. H159]|uniref:VOC family protein n=1 Tax=Georgenia sp. H159 TaxID=3076115 RepID=UPI002D77EF46|nr:VOC family protein [Georgenia sp. H159]
MPSIATCLWFDTEGLEAAEFYVSVFPRSEVVEVTRWGGSNPEREGEPLTVHFRLDGRDFTALNGGPGHPLTDAISVEVQCADQAEVDHYWERLLEAGGREVQCGWLTDRYGLSWQIVPTRMIQLLKDPDPGRARRAMEAMMQMVKIDVAAVERAADAA